MPDNNRWTGPSEDQLVELKRLLGDVPSRTIVQYDWRSPEGRAFVKLVRKMQMGMVSLPKLAEAIDVSHATLSGAITYWERPPSSRNRRRLRQPRPLGKTSPSTDVESIASSEEE